MNSRFNSLNRLAMILVADCKFNNFADFLVVSIRQIPIHFLSEFEFILFFIIQIQLSSKQIIRYDVESKNSKVLSIQSRKRLN